MRVQIPHVTKVEGHGNLIIEVEGDKIKDVRFGIHEGPRYFEALLVGRKAMEVPELAGRICGICTVIHTICAAKAVERAAGWTPDDKLEMLRDLLTYSSHIQSHVLHLYFLALPDYLGKGSVLEMVEEYGDELKRAFAIKKASNEMTELIGGRKVHPCTVIPGAITKEITVETLKAYERRMEMVARETEAMARLFLGLEYPEHETRNDLLALRDGKGIPLLDGEVASLNGLSFPQEEYIDRIEERVVPPHTAKRSYVEGKPFFVGALARLGINSGFLREEARTLAEEFGVKFPSRNTFLNNAAQALECVHYAHLALDLVREMIDRRFEYIPPSRDLKFRDGGEGVAVVEAPRGLLVHHYRVDRRGSVRYANIITPTAFNFAQIEDDLRAYLPSVGVSDALKLEAEKLIRAYDPCISCSAHVVRVKDAPDEGGREGA